MMGDSPCQLAQGFPFFMGCRDIQEDQFISTLGSVTGSQLNGITCIPKIDKVCSLYSSAIPYIQTGNDSFG
jgi:hypothetical protein